MPNLSFEILQEVAATLSITGTRKLLEDLFGTMLCGETTYLGVVLSYTQNLHA